MKRTLVFSLCALAVLAIGIVIAPHAWASFCYGNQVDASVWHEQRQAEGGPSCDNQPQYTQTELCRTGWWDENYCDSWYWPLQTTYCTFDKLSTTNYRSNNTIGCDGNDSCAIYGDAYNSYEPLGHQVPCGSGE